MGQAFNFNPMQYDVQTALEPLPTGWYSVIIAKAEVAETQAKDGFVLKTDFKVIDGPYKDRIVKRSFNLQNPSAQAVEIGQKQITTMCGCMNVWTGIQNTDQICNIPFQVRFVVNGEYNDAKGFKTINGDDPVKPGTAAAAVATPGPVVAQPASAPPPPPAPAAPAPAVSDSWQRTPDGAWMLDPSSNSWVPNIPPAAPAPPQQAAPPPPPVYNPPPAYAPPAQPGAAPAAAAAQPPTWTPNQMAQPPVWRP